MAKVFIEETTLTAIGDAIRGKTGKTDLIDPANMSTEIAGIEAGGGGGVEIPDSVFNLTGDIGYRFSGGGWDWFLEDYGHKMTTKDVTNLASTFQSCKLTEIPFQINVKDLTSLSYAFQATTNLTVCPKIRGTIKWGTSSPGATDPLGNMYRLRDLEDLFEPETIRGFSAYKVTSAWSCPYTINPASMYSLRRVPSWWYEFRLNPESTSYPSYTNNIYSGGFASCFVLDELKNIPVWHCAGAQTSDMFYGLARSCNRLKALTFETNTDGSPIETKWKSQTIDLTSGIGYSQSTMDYSFVDYNSGITTDKRVNSDATYQALKNDPDWYTCSLIYSRYNHDSAVETINSLPDTSVYLASAGGTNTIKFKGDAGSATDGGAINTLTEEEIAVATAKGWTVTLS